MKYLDPKNDFIFKKVFGQHPHLLRSFLNALLPLEEGRVIESLEYLPAELVPQIPVMKYSIVDVRCKDNYGRQFIVEMQMQWTTGFLQRVLFNASKAYVNQLDHAVDYKALHPVYALSLINDVFDKQTEDYYHHYQIVNIANTEKKIEGLEFVFVELPKFRARNLGHKKLQVLWLRFLTEINESMEDVPDDLLDSVEIAEALNNVKTSAYTRAELEVYDRYWDSVRTELTIRTDSFEIGKAAGKAEGRAEGRAEGLYLAAISAFLHGAGVDVVSNLLGLPVETSNKLHELVKYYGDNAKEHLPELEQI
ncbi:MAG: Rpn family recombination-promoting nuclease/putative transposase [Bacteroidales bacterium]|nr:Rpn family recombination-promoting nuclease/putative transposase [Bacteroidales bacterium]MDD3664721.1 Rpn family recombination-promoting nuclease/putative transposase [Bacteroidales bacterium]